jgi:hypothetical protein
MTLALRSRAPASASPFVAGTLREPSRSTSLLALPRRVRVPVPHPPSITPMPWPRPAASFGRWSLNG